LDSRYKYGVLGAGAVSSSLVGRLPSKTRELGPVSGSSYRVASRIANTLRAGYPVRTADELNEAPCVLFHAPPDRAPGLLGKLEKAEIDWQGKALVFCDCVIEPAVRQRFKARGASTAVIRQFGIPGRLIVEFDPGSAARGSPASQMAQRMARELRMKAVPIAPGSEDVFDAAMTLGGAALTPLIDRAAALLRDAGIRDIEAAQLAASLFEQTARDYGHSGKQSWAWYVKKPPVAGLKAQIAAAGPHLEPVLRQLVSFGMETFRKHAEVAAELNSTNQRTLRQSPP
jgi:hypothetical protein